MCLHTYFRTKFLSISLCTNLSGTLCCIQTALLSTLLSWPRLMQGSAYSTGSSSPAATNSSTVSTSPDLENLAMPVGVAVSFYSDSASYQDVSFPENYERSSYERSVGKASVYTATGDGTPYTGGTPYGPSRSPSLQDYEWPSPKGIAPFS